MSIISETLTSYRFGYIFRPVMNSVPGVGPKFPFYCINSFGQQLLGQYKILAMPLLALVKLTCKGLPIPLRFISVEFPLLLLYFVLLIVTIPDWELDSGRSRDEFTSNQYKKCKSGTCMISFFILCKVPLECLEGWQYKTFVNNKLTTGKLHRKLMFQKTRHKLLKGDHPRGNINAVNYFMGFREELLWS